MNIFLVVFPPTGAHFEDSYPAYFRRQVLIPLLRASESFPALGITRVVVFARGEEIREDKDHESDGRPLHEESPSMHEAILSRKLFPGIFLDGEIAVPRHTCEEIARTYAEAHGGEGVFLWLPERGVLQNESLSQAVGRLSADTGEIPVRHIIEVPVDVEV